MTNVLSRRFVATALVAGAPAAAVAALHPSALKPGEYRRLSTEPADPSFPTWLALRRADARVTILLDGKEVDQVMTADSDLGYVVCAIPEPGHPECAFCIEHNGRSLGKIAIEVLYGKVEIFVA